jgi:hypothetical protein
MSFVFVWGTRVREIDKGSVGFQCAYCCEVVVGDCVSVEVANHVYFIRGRFKERSRYIRCRLCGIGQDIADYGLLPEQMAEDQVWPSADALARTNPSQAGAPLGACVPESDLPGGITRRQWALLSGLEAALEREAADDRVGGNTEGLVSISALGVIGSLVAIWVKVPEGNRSPALLLMLTGWIVVAFGIYRLHGWMLFRATLRRFGPHLRRHLRATGDSLEMLRIAADLMGKPARRLQCFLEWAARRM